MKIKGHHEGASPGQYRGSVPEAMKIKGHHEGGSAGQYRRVKAEAYIRRARGGVCCRRGGGRRREEKSRRIKSENHSQRFGNKSERISGVPKWAKVGE